MQNEQQNQYASQIPQEHLYITVIFALKYQDGNKLETCT